MAEEFMVRNFIFNDRCLPPNLTQYLQQQQQQQLQERSQQIQHYHDEEELSRNQENENENEIESVQELLVEEVRARRCIWDTSCKSFKELQKKQEACRKIARKLKTEGSLL